MEAIVSVVVVMPRCNVSPGTTAINAFVANAALVAANSVPALRELAHAP